MHVSNFTQTLFLFLALCISIPVHSQYHLNGSAIGISRNCFQLTPDLQDHNGSVWYGEKVDLREPFDLQTRINLGCNDGGADGIAFVLQPISTNIGSVGGGIGYLDISPSFAVEFDTYRNDIHADPYYDHVAIQKNGDTGHIGVNNLAGPVQILPGIDNLEDCQYHDLRTTWDPETFTMNIYVNCMLRLSYTGDIVTEVFGSDPMVFWGFTSATGGLTNIHEVCFDFISFLDQPPNPQICIGQSAYLNPGPGNFISWLPHPDLNNLNTRSPQVSPSTTTTYTAQFLLTCGDIRESNITVFVSGSEAPDLGPDIRVCEGETVNLSHAAAPNETLTWNTGETTGSITVDQPGTYILEVDAPNCPALSDTVEVIMEPPLNIAPVADQLICEGDSFFVDVANAQASGYLWNTGESTSGIFAKEPGTYQVEVFHGQCPSVVQSFSLLTEAPIVAPAQTNIDVCAATNVVLDATNANALGYTWSTNENTALISVSNSGTYTVDLLGNACPNVSQTFIIDIKDEISIDLGMDTTICTGEMFVLDASHPNATSYTWNDGDTEATKVITQTGTYIVNLEVPDCPLATDTIEIQLLDAPQVNLGSDSTLCLGESLLLDAEDIHATSYLWENGSTSPQRQIDLPGTYSVRLSNGICQEVIDSILVFMEDPPLLDLGRDTTLCEGESMTLDGTGLHAQAYAWADGETNPIRVIMEGGTYVLQAENSYCPAALDSIVIAVQVAPEVDLGSDTTICFGQTLSLDASSQGAETYLWQDGFTQANRTITDGGIYTVSLQNAVCPPVTDTIVVQISDSLLVDLGPDTVLCEGQSLLLNATSANAESYLWQDGDTRPLKQIMTGGTYIVEVNSADCPNASDTLFVKVQEAPMVHLGADTTICEGEILILDALDMNATSYTWEDGESDAIKTVNTKGLYHVTVENAYCPPTSDSILVDVALPVQLDIGNDTLICSGTALQLNAFHPDAQYYRWSTGENSPRISIQNGGWYSVSAGNMICPDGSDSIFVQISDPKANFLMSPDPVLHSIVEGQQMTFQNISIDAASYLWRIPELEQQHEGESFFLDFPEDGIYTIQLIVGDSLGICQDSISKKIEVGNIAVYIPNAFTPNGNGTNESWRVVATGLSQLGFQVFNRWGKLVFETQSIDGIWYGKDMEQRPVPEGVYVYKVNGRFQSGEEFVRAGTVTLIR